MLDFTAFSHGQVESKIWLCERLEPVIPSNSRIAILGGWYGILAFLLLSRRAVDIKHIRSFDIDPKVESIADKINNAWVCNEWQFKAITQDANQVDFSKFDVIINTSAEHIIDKQWFDKITNQLVVIQSTDQIHDDEDDHDYCFSVDQLAKQYPLTNLYRSEKKFTYPDKDFSRFMLIGYKTGS
jgi:predicted RNA methylase